MSATSYFSVFLFSAFFILGIKLADIGKLYYLCNIICMKKMPINDNMEYLSVKQWAESHGVAERTAYLRLFIRFRMATDVSDD